MDALRGFFVGQGFYEVDTPVAIRAPAPEVAIEAVPVRICADGFERRARSAEQRFLQTSPELAMKRLVARGLSPIFQVAPVFRDGDHSSHHAPEFRMLEWYRAQVPYTKLMDDCEQLIAILTAKAQSLLRDEPSANHVNPRLWRAPPPWPRLTVGHCFEAYAGICLDEARTTEALMQRARAKNIHFEPQDSWNELFYRIFVGCIEPALHRLPTPVFIYEFPAPEAALARLKPENPSVAERFELYAFGMELANAFGELTDPYEQRARFNAARQARREMQRRDYPLDELFLGALHDLPETSGIALGVERLMMLLLGAEHIRDVSFLPWDEA